MRERAAEIVTLDLGPRTDLEIENRLRAEIEQERFTSLDRNLRKEADEEGQSPARRKRSRCVPPFATRGTLAEAETPRPGAGDRAGTVAAGPETWSPPCAAWAQRGDIIKTMHQAMVRADVGRSVSDYAIYDPDDAHAETLIGRVLARGLSDELNDRHYLIVDGVDGRSHYVDIGRADATEPIAEGFDHFR